LASALFCTVVVITFEFSHTNTIRHTNKEKGKKKKKKKSTYCLMVYLEDIYTPIGCQACDNKKWALVVWGSWKIRDVHLGDWRFVGCKILPRKLG
jgi:hypothetical protein